MLTTVSSITNAIGALNYKGTWNASTNTPTLADGTGAKGDYYVVSTAGTQTFGGVQLFFGTGDWIAYNGAVWQRVEGGSDGNFANVTLTSTDAGASASPLLELYRDSASPAASDTLGEIEFNGEDSAGNKQTYGLIRASILSPTSGAEQGQIHIETATGGVLTEKMIIGTTNLVVNEIGAVFNVRIEGDTDANLFFTDATNDRIGVGTISPSVKFEVNGAAKVSGTLSGGTSGTGYVFSGSAAANSLALDSSGNFMVGTDNSSGTISDGFKVLSKRPVTVNAASTDGTTIYEAYSTGASAYRFYVGMGGTIFATSIVISAISDERLKENVRDIDIGLDAIMALKPRRFDWKEGKGQDKKNVAGFIAQEFEQVFPECVGVSKAGEDGIEYKNINHETLIPTLVKAIQEQQDLITILTARVAQLESKE